MYVIGFFFIAQLVLLVLSVVDTQSGSVRPVPVDSTALWLVVVIVVALYSLFPRSAIVQNWLTPAGFLALGILFLEYTGSADAAADFVILTVLMYALFLVLMRFVRLVGVVVVVTVFLVTFLGLSGPPSAF